MKDWEQFHLVLVEMKSFVLLLGLLQALGCSGAPLHNAELEAMADRGLGAALTRVNSVYAMSNLYRATRASVTRVIPVGLNTADLMMTFGIKETECAKESSNDPQTCAFRPGFFVASRECSEKYTDTLESQFWLSFSCSSRVRVSATSAQVISLRCGLDGSSSSESSSEEVFSRGRHQFNIPFANRVPAPSAPPPPVQSERFRTADVPSRGDTFDNYLV